MISISFIKYIYIIISWYPQLRLRCLLILTILSAIKHIAERIVLIIIVVLDSVLFNITWDQSHSHMCYNKQRSLILNKRSLLVWKVWFKLMEMEIATQAPEDYVGEKRNVFLSGSKPIWVRSWTVRALSLVTPPCLPFLERHIPR